MSSVSLSMRYKSATVDAFIEEHASDVSPRGIFIKTDRSVPLGTRVELRLQTAGKQTLIAGVGRIAWIRDPAHAAAERPAGMGIKFIDVDGPSRTLIEKIRATRPDAGARYEAERETTARAASSPPSVAPPAPTKDRPAGPASAPPAASRSAQKVSYGALPPISPPPRRPSFASLPPPSLGSGVLPPMALPPRRTSSLPPAPSPPKPVSGPPVVPVDFDDDEPEETLMMSHDDLHEEVKATRVHPSLPPVVAPLGRGSSSSAPPPSESPASQPTPEVAHETPAASLPSTRGKPPVRPTGRRKAVAAAGVFLLAGLALGLLATRPWTELHVVAGPAVTAAPPLSPAPALPATTALVAASPATSEGEPHLPVGTPPRNPSAVATPVAIATGTPSAKPPASLLAAAAATNAVPLAAPPNATPMTKSPPVGAPRSSRPTVPPPASAAPRTQTKIDDGF